MKKIIFLLFFLFFIFINFQVQAETVLYDGGANAVNACNAVADPIRVSQGAWCSFWSDDGHCGAGVNCYVCTFWDGRLYQPCGVFTFTEVGVSCPAGTTADLLGACIAPPPKDCFSSYNDLDPVKSGIQCTCGGFLPASSVSANGVTCDGVKLECPIGSQKIINVVGGITVLSCQDIVVCDPLTDPNQCGSSVVSACITTNQADPCLDPSSLVDNTVPDLCPVGYYYNKKDKKCYPIKKKETIVDNKTGETTTITTVNNSSSVSSSVGDTTTYQNTTDSTTGQESKDEQLPDFVLSASGFFDIATAQSSLLSKQSELGALMDRLKTESTGMFSVTQGVAQLPCYDFTLPFNGGIKKVCFSEHPQVFDILIPLLAFLGYFIAFTIILRN